MDWRVFHAINEFAKRSAWLHAPAKLAADGGLFAIAALLVLGYVAARAAGPQAVARSLWAGAAVLASLALNVALVAAFDRARPYESHRHVLALLTRTHDPSFPSDHCVAAGAAIVGLWFVSRRLSLAAIAIASVMALARVYVGRHYPSDVLVGLAVGGAVAALGRPLVDRWVTPAVERLGTTRLRRLVRRPAVQSQ